MLSTNMTSKRKMRQVAAFLVTAAAVGSTLALAPYNDLPKKTTVVATGPVLPPLTLDITTERRRQSTRPSPKSNRKHIRRKSLQGTEERALPEIIPRLSDLYRSSGGEKTMSLSTKRNETDTRPIMQGNKARRQEPRNISSNNDDDEPRLVLEKTPTASVAPMQQKNRIPVEPWKASFQSSIRTQGRIKKEFQIYTEGESPNRKAKRILQALLSTDPTHCNAANVVGALTFSVKALGSRRIEPDPQLRSMLFETLDVLHSLVNERLLSTRQLCNACWAIAKHYDRDNALLPFPPEAISLSSEEALGTAEQWDIILDEANNDNDGKKMKEQQKRVDETVDSIANQIALILDESWEEFSVAAATDDSTSATPPPLQAKVGEICMASWAFGKLRPRSTPPGWEIPPQLGKLPNARNEVTQMARTASMITFEQWGSFGRHKKQNKNDQGSLSSVDVTGKLFDTIAASLCRSPAAMGITVDPKMDGSDTTNVGASINGHASCLEICSWSELANVGWSFASNGRCRSKESQMLLQSLAREARYRLEVGGDAMKDFLIRDIAQLLWALGTLQADNFRLADDLVWLVQCLSNYLRLGEKAPSFGRGRRLTRWSCADLVQVALSLAHARIDDLNLLRAIYEESHHRLLEEAHNDFNDQDGRNSFRPWEVSILLWAQARLYLKEEQGYQFEDFTADAPKFLLSSLSRKCQTLTECGIGAQEQANIVWSLTVLEHHQSPGAIELINRIFYEASHACTDQHTIQLEHAHQLWQAYFLLEEESPESVANVPTWFVNYLKDKWSIEKARDKLSSARHKALSQTLNLMGVRHFNEHDEDIDVAIVLRKGASWTHETEHDEQNAGHQVNVAVEFDGPNHFTREKIGADKSIHPRALGHTVLKYRLLKKQGWSVVRVPYFEFDKIPFWASMERQRYLQRKLKTHANIQFSEVDASEYKAIQPNFKSRFD